jgi:hypothetical protein
MNFENTSTNLTISKDDIIPNFYSPTTKIDHPKHCSEWPISFWNRMILFIFYQVKERGTNITVKVLYYDVSITILKLQY